MITEQYLRDNPDHIFVFGDNLVRKGKGGAATLRDEPNVYGFITKKCPNNRDSSFYTPASYKAVYASEIVKLMVYIDNAPCKQFLISKLGSGLANRYKIFERIIEPNIKKDLAKFDNVEFLW